VNLNLTQEKLERIIDSLPVGVMVFDKETRLKLWNETSLELTGIGIENIVSENYIDSLHADIREMLTAAHAVKNPKYFRKLIEWDENGHSHMIDCILDSKEDDTVLIVQNASRFMEVERIKRDFIGTLLHKLRTPLSTLKTSHAMLQGGVVKEVPPQAREILDMGYHELNRLVTLVNDLRDLFLIETGLMKKEMDEETYPFSAALNRAVEELAKSIGSVQKRLVISGRFDRNVTTDFEMLTKVFLILLKNAFMYSPETAEVKVVCEERDTDTEIRVEDKGIGIRKKSLPFLFSKYFRETNETTRDREGNGLGLFVAKSFIEMMNGTIFCESIPGKGSVFSFIIPHSGTASHG
jgi:signal transduction histidine kinase